MRLKDKVAIVTGGASGIGKAVVRRFIDEGATVALCDINRDNADAVIGEMASEGTIIQYFEMNVMEEDSVKDGMEAIYNAFGKIDILINCAGICIHQAVTDFTDEVYSFVMGLNVKGTMLCTKHAVPYMKKNGQGSIVNLSSVVAQSVTKNQAPYASAKGALIALTRQTAYDLARNNIRVNCVCPGDTLTERLLSTMTEERQKELSAHYPMGRFSTPEEQAAVILFLAGDVSSFVTGQAIVADGGYSIW